MSRQEEVIIDSDILLVKLEIIKAKAKYQDDFNSFHEGYAVLLEEVDELWDEVKKKVVDKQKAKEEAVQVAAMALRIVSELCKD